MSSQISISIGDWRPAPQSVSRTLYAIGDVHGNARKLEALITHLRANLQPGGVLVYLGDLIDPHPRDNYAHDCAAVVDIVATPLPQTETIVLCGNHDAFLLIAAEAAKNNRDVPWADGHWWAQGGKQTAAAWGITIPPGIPLERDIASAMFGKMTPTQRGVFERMKIWHDHDAYLLVHAGFEPRVPLEKQQARASILEYPTVQTEDEHPLWMRFSHNTDAAPKRRVLIHGHTSLRKAYLGKKRICIDTGVKYGGPLTALEIVGERMRIIQADEEVS